MLVYQHRLVSFASQEELVGFVNDHWIVLTVFGLKIVGRFSTGIRLNQKEMVPWDSFWRTYAFKIWCELNLEIMFKYDCSQMFTYLKQTKINHIVTENSANWNLEKLNRIVAKFTTEIARVNCPSFWGTCCCELSPMESFFANAFCKTLTSPSR